MIDKLKHYINVLSRLGCDHTLDQLVQSRIILSNQIMLICIGATLPFLVVFPMLGEPMLGWGIVFLCGLYASVLYCNICRFYFLASLLAYGLPMVGIIFYFLYSGRDVGFHYILLFCSSLGAIIFSHTTVLSLSVVLVIPILLFLGLDMLGDSYVIRFLFEGMVVNLLHGVSILITFLCTLSCLVIYRSQSTTLVLEQKEQTIKAQLELNHVMKDIEEKNNLIDSFESKESYVQITQGIAHEIRSPMASLLAGAELLKDNSDNKQAVDEFSELMIKTIRRLTLLTQSMLSFSGSLSKGAHSFLVQTLLEELVALARLQCSKKQLTLHLNCSYAGDMIGNRLYVAQALLNVVVNAIQYSYTKGHIYIDAILSNKQTILITIVDEGEGIKSENLKRIFEQRYSTKKTSHNAGLGLAFVKRVMDDHQGTVTVDSTNQEGTVFRLYFPLNTSMRVSV